MNSQISILFSGLRATTIIYFETHCLQSAQRELLQGDISVLWTHPHPSLTESFFLATKCCRLILYLPCLHPKTGYFSKESQFLEAGKDI